MVPKKKHPLAGRKQSKETIAKRIATMTARRQAREVENDDGVQLSRNPEKRKYTKRAPVDTRTPEQFRRDANEALWCITQAVAKTRKKIASGQLALNDVTDEETLLYMAKRYLEGGLKP